MKKFYIKQQIFSAIDKFTVKDENEQDCYLVEGDFVQIGGKKLHIKDMNGKELAMVKQKLLSLMPKFFVYIGDEEVATIKKKIALLGSKYLIEGPGWEVKGNILGHDYTITDGNTEIITLHKVWLSWGDSYEINISDNADVVIALAVVIAIDMVLSSEALAVSVNKSTELRTCR